jgi:hypothetical protein
MHWSNLPRAAATDTDWLEHMNVIRAILLEQDRKFRTEGIYVDVEPYNLSLTRFHPDDCTVVTMSYESDRATAEPGIRRRRGCAARLWRDDFHGNVHIFQGVR